MKTLFTNLLMGCLLFTLSCSPPPLPLPTASVVGTWRTNNFRMASAEVNAYISLAFYENQHFSLKLNLPLGGDAVRPFKWGGDWSLQNADELQLVYVGESGFMGTFSEQREIFEKFNFMIQDDYLTMSSEMRGINFKLRLHRVE